MKRVEAVTPEALFDLKMIRAIRESLPVLVVLFTPINLVYSSYFIPDYAINIFFLIVRFDIYNRVDGIYQSFTLVNIDAFLVLSIPAFLVSIASFWILRSLSHKKTTSRGALKGIVGVVLIWVIYLAILFLGTLSVGFFLVGPIPLPFGPLVAILSRSRIIELNNQIDGLENSPPIQ